MQSWQLLFKLPVATDFGQIKDNQKFCTNDDCISHVLLFLFGEGLGLFAIKDVVPDKLNIKLTVFS